MTFDLRRAWPSFLGGRQTRVSNLKHGAASEIEYQSTGTEL